MTCFNPIPAFMPADIDGDGKRRLIFNPEKINEYIRLSDLSKHFLPHSDFKMSYDNHHIILDSGFQWCGNIKGYLVQVPCGKCLGCRNDYARRWSVRCYHEGFMHDHFKNCAFLTLTFNNNMLYKRKNPWSVDKQQFSSWIKRFREQIRSKYAELTDTKIRFFACGEYGSKGRPHYHMLLYGFNFPDKYVIQGPGYPKKLQPKVVNGRIVKTYRSPFLEECWSPAGSSDSFGFSTISDVNQFTCNYVARYVMKKSGLDEFPNREPVFTNTSRMPGLGSSYFDLYYKNIMSLGYIHLPNGAKSDIPRYYIDRLKNIDPELYNRYKLDKFHNMCYNFFNETSEQLDAKEYLLNEKLDKYVRIYEDDTDLHNI